MLLSNLGYSRTGEVFNLPAEELAGEVARALKADKLVYLQQGLDQGETAASTLSTNQCETLLADPDTTNDMRNLLSLAIEAIQAQVKRVHFIDSRVDGGLPTAYIGMYVAETDICQFVLPWPKGSATRT